MPAKTKPRKAVRKSILKGAAKARATSFRSVEVSEHTVRAHSRRYPTHKDEQTVKDRQINEFAVSYCQRLYDTGVTDQDRENIRVLLQMFDDLGATQTQDGR